MKKYREVSEMEGNTWYEPGDPELYRAIAAVWEFAERTLQPRFPPGVYKHRSFEAMERQSEAWREANFRAYRRRIGRPVPGDDEAG